MEELALQDVLKPPGEGCFGFCASFRGSLEACSPVLLFSCGESISSGHLETGAGSSSAAKSVVSVFTISEGVEALRNLWHISGVEQN